ncbi:MAG: alpha/beta hydrolase family protein [Candidatus Nanohaloarchaea archaeon]
MPEKHFIEVENDEEVAAVHHEAPGDRWLFFCHGFGSDKEGSYVGRCERAVENGFNAVRFDFRGNGESHGKFIEQTLSSKIADLKSVVDYFSPQSYVFFGSSFGGKVAFHASQELEPGAVLGRAPVTYNSIMEKYRSVVENKGEFTHHEGATIDQRFFDDFDTYSFDEVAETLEVPVAIFHGGADTTVHIENTWNAADALETDVTVQKLAGEKHHFSDAAEQKMQDIMFYWLETVWNR